MDFTNFKAIIDKYVGKYYPGLDICVHQKGEEIIRYQAGYHNMDTNTPVDPDALYYIFSCSKPATCTAALQFLEKGYYRLEDPVYDFIPEFKDVVVKRVKENGVIAYEKPKTPVTIGQLFSMTSGINYEVKTPYIDEVREKTDGRMPTLEVVKAIAKNPLEFHPGEHWRYGLNHDVLGGLIEIWSGMKFGDYMKKYIFDACGMKRTGFKVTDEVRAKVAPMCKRNEATNEYTFVPSTCEYMLGEDSEYESGGAGIISCVEDYIGLADALANGGVCPRTGEKLLNQRTIDLMRTNRLAPHQLKEFGPKADNGYGYGLGVRTLMTNAGGTLCNVGEFGWDGAAACYFVADPAAELSMFMGQNMRPSLNYKLSIMLVNALYSDLYR